MYLNFKMFYKLKNWQFIVSMLAILVFSTGLLLALYFYINQNPSGVNFAQSEPVTREPVSLIFNLSSPDDNLLTFDSDLLVTGKTSPGSVIIISLNDDDQSLEVSSQGDFSTTLKLQPGVNSLTIASFDLLGNSKSEERTIYYSKEKI